MLNPSETHRRWRPNDLAHTPHGSLERGFSVDFWDPLWLMIWGFFFISYLMVLFQVIITSAVIRP